MPQQEAFPRSKAAALKAVELNHGSSDAHAVLGELAFYYEWDWPKAEKEFNPAIKLDTNNAGAHASYAIYLTAMSTPPADDAKGARRGSPPHSLRDYWQQRIETETGNKSVETCWQAQLYAHLDNKARTLELLDWSYQNHCDGAAILEGGANLR